METTTTAPAIRYSGLLPFWAVLTADVRQTFRGWIYRTWLFLSVAAMVGYVLYSFGAKQESGRIVQAHNMISEAMRWTLWGSVFLIIVLAAGTICSELGNVADSILCRGISRYQYYVGKWMARLFLVLATYFLLAGGTMGASFLLLHGDNLSLQGCALAFGVVAALLVFIVTCGVTVSAIVNNTVLSIALVWLMLYGSGFLLSMLPEQYPSPEKTLRNLPNILRGYYDIVHLGRLITGTLAMSLGFAMVGMFTFARKDV